MLALAVDFPYFIKIITKGEKMKKKLLVLIIAVIPTLMPNLASAIAIDVGDITDFRCDCGCAYGGCYFDF
jgi:hypothetical protein